MLLYVVESSGSSPGRQGFSMTVNLAGEMNGSLGGGIMEHKFVEMAKARLAEQPAEISIHKQIHNKTAAAHQSGMICSGEQTILLYTVQQHDAVAVQTIISSLEKNKNGLLQLSPDGINFKQGSFDDVSIRFALTTSRDWLYREIIGYKNHLFIIGGGHCALALSRIMQQMDFYIHLFENRKQLNTLVQNNFVHEKEILDDYQELSGRIHSSANHYIVIMSFGYRTDAVALRALIDKNFRYLGLLGSKAKTAKMLEDFKKEGFNEALLKRIYAPVGIPIKSQTPEEVAISIAAEIIQVKNG